MGNGDVCCKREAGADARRLMSKRRGGEGRTGTFLGGEPSDLGGDLSRMEGTGRLGWILVQESIER